MKTIIKYLFLTKIRRYIFVIGLIFLIWILSIFDNIFTYDTIIYLSYFLIPYMLYELLTFYIDVNSNKNILYLEASISKYKIFYSHVITSLIFIVITMIIFIVFDLVINSISNIYSLAQYYTFPLNVNSFKSLINYYLNTFIYLVTAFNIVLLFIFIYIYSPLRNFSKYLKIILINLLILIALLIPVLLLPFFIHNIIMSNYQYNSFFINSVVLIILFISTLLNSFIYQVKR